MSISPPSDILLGVAKAADPQKYRAAVDKLAQTANGRSVGGEFSAVVEATASAAAQNTAAPSVKAAGPSIAAPQIDTHRNPIATAAKRPDKAYVKFEAFFLQTVVESMLPKESDKFFGTGQAGAIWKSMLAEHIAGAMAQAGGIGIAAKLADHQEKMRKSIIPSASANIGASAGQSQIQPPLAAADRKANSNAGGMSGAASTNRG